jgi:signal transduction histidine kinase/ActR/RegA family two-component response regulator
MKNTPGKEQAVQRERDVAADQFKQGLDASECRTLEKELHFTAARLNEAQRLARLGSWELDLLSGELVWSDEVFRMFEIDKCRFAGGYRAFLELIHPDDRARVNLAYTRSLQTRSEYEINHRLLLPDGRIKWVHERCVSEFDAQGKALRSMGTVQDITERHLAQAALRQLNDELEQRVAQRTAELERARNEAEQANNAKSDFLTRMSHELRTPLNGILGFAQLLAYNSNHALDLEQADYVQEIMHSGKHLLELINEVLDLSRIESGRLELEPMPLAMAQMLRECATMVQTLAAERRVEISCDITGDYIVRADRLRLRQIFLNLLSNAVKYNREGGSVAVGCCCSRDGWVRVSVRDSGRGIAADALPRLFRPFERLQSACDGSEGSGIGLAITRKLTEAMGGNIGVESVAGAGSTFWVEFPLLTGSATVPPLNPEAMQAAKFSTRTVLYIEDNPLSVRLVQKSISGRLGIVMFGAYSAELGLQMARSRRPDIILLDINLPGMNGFEALDILKNDAVTRDIPVVAISANAMERDIKKGLDAGFVDYLTKPVDIIQLVLVLSRLAQRQCSSV